MSQGVFGELFFCLLMAASGVLILFGYDLLRVLRRVFPHGNLLVAAEDFLYWSGAGILAFGVIFLRNSGEVRGFALFALGLGMLLYHWSASRFFVAGASAVFCFFRDVLVKIGGFLYRPLLCFVKKTGKICKKALKYSEKCGKMTMLYKRGMIKNKEGSVYEKGKKKGKTV